MQGDRKGEVLSEIITLCARVRATPRTFWQRLGQRLDGALEQASGGRTFRKAAVEFGRLLEGLDLSVLAAFSAEERQIVIDKAEAVIEEIERYLGRKGWARSSQEGLPYVTLVYQLRAAIERIYQRGGRPGGV